MNTLIPFCEADVLFVGLARDCELTIEHTVLALLEAFSEAKTLRYYVVESDSTDGTVERLESMSQSIPGFQFESHGCLSERFPKRTERLAFCRNRY